jgi:hypothetical protein
MFGAPRANRIARYCGTCIIRKVLWLLMVLNGASVALQTSVQTTAPLGQVASHVHWRTVTVTSRQIAALE